ncbi:uncharacterized protein EI97DRAFT_408137 [Westerdykella ornata]|uniref:C2H2-type domain-containing protein n=1 Tax=Westerdykella ornata TaxID=318751 RepID=A0A6A6J4G0_WESOR|nr:uncharacterized protein EI97DRAFT_408137 [Westerdykella ornata]KAF2271460.1 hypothetical protein EI97DRAFT_408137 [Westerdykella ornata]
MHKRLFFALLITLLLEPAAAASPAMDATLPLAPMESTYPDPDGILAGICGLCSMPLDCCSHALNSQPIITADTLLNHPEWPASSRLVLEDSPEPQPQHPRSPMDSSESVPLYNAFLRRLECDSTSVSRHTIEIHVHHTYLPGDRIAQQGERRPHSQRRHPPRTGGFPCSFEGCDKAFDRRCELNRHQKIHLDRSERPHKCPICHEGFLYPKDRNRHQRTHDPLASPGATLYCHLPGCNNVDGFSRRDNLLRHQRRQHPNTVISA